MGTINTPPKDDWFEAMKKAILLDRIELAKANALPRAELDKLQEEEDAITAKFLAGKLTSAQCELEFNKIKPKLEHIVIFQTEADFRRSLELLDIDVISLEEALTHELAHFKTARQKKLRTRLCLKFFKEGNRLGVVPATRIEMNSDFSDLYLRDGLKDITSAPTDLSQSDKRRLTLID